MSNTPKKTNLEKGNARSLSKRPRAPIACFRCHHKKVRCDGAHPNCNRCSSTGVLCAYPSSRRSRTTQPTNIDPFIDNISHLEARIRRIESDLEHLRSSVCSMVSPNNKDLNTTELKAKMTKTEAEVNDSRSILAQLRLRGEQRISRGKRAAAAALAANSNSDPMPKEESTTTSKNQSKLKYNNSKKSSLSPQHSVDSQKTVTPTSSMLDSKLYHPFYFQGMMLDDNTDMSNLGNTTQGMDWTLFDHPPTVTVPTALSEEQYRQQINDHRTHNMSQLFHQNQINMFPNQQQQEGIIAMSPASSRSSSLTSLGYYPMVMQASSSTTSTTSNATSATTFSSNTAIQQQDPQALYSFRMEDMMLDDTTPSQDVQHMLPNPTAWYYPS